MDIEMYQVDAFANRLFAGNPAAVIVRDEWLSDELMQQIAMENNLAETAYVVPEEGNFRLRWFTPVTEVRLCGHATLASAHVLFSHLGYGADQIIFESLSGPLTVTRREGGLYEMDFPTNSYTSADDSHEEMVEILGFVPIQVVRGEEDFLALVDSQSTLDDLKPDLRRLKQVDARGLLVTAPGLEVDFVSRCFFPRYGIDEDPVTGSAHTLLTPFWAERLGKDKLIAQQRSARRGTVHCELKGDRVLLGGHAVTYMKGNLRIDGIQ